MLDPGCFPCSRFHNDFSDSTSGRIGRVVGQQAIFRTTLGKDWEVVVGLLNLRTCNYMTFSLFMPAQLPSSEGWTGQVCSRLGWSV
jgi:hypothetical protein